VIPEEGVLWGLDAVKLAAAGMPVTTRMFVSPPAYFCTLKQLRSVNRAPNDQYVGVDPVGDAWEAVAAGGGVT
jgi:hypothetical protein